MFERDLKEIRVESCSLSEKCKGPGAWLLLVSKAGSGGAVRSRPVQGGPAGGCWENGEGGTGPHLGPDSTEKSCLLPSHPRDKSCYLFVCSL